MKARLIRRLSLGAMIIFAGTGVYAECPGGSHEASSADAVVGASNRNAMPKIAGGAKNGVEVAKLLETKATDQSVGKKPVSSGANASKVKP
ncbi:MAG: hypothetical protein ABIQ90_09450 [Polaromonas sp.]